AALCSCPTARQPHRFLFQPGDTIRQLADGLVGSAEGGRIEWISEVLLALLVEGFFLLLACGLSIGIVGSENLLNPLTMAFAVDPLLEMDHQRGCASHIAIADTVDLRAELIPQRFIQ